MTEDYWERDRRITCEYLKREAVANYIEEFGLTKPKDLKLKEKVIFDNMVFELRESLRKINKVKA